MGEPSRRGDGRTAPLGAERWLRGHAREAAAIGGVGQDLGAGDRTLPAPAMPADLVDGLLGDGHCAPWLGQSRVDCTRGSPHPLMEDLRLCRQPLLAPPACARTRPGTPSRVRSARSRSSRWRSSSRAAALGAPPPPPRTLARPRRRAHRRPQALRPRPARSRPARSPPQARRQRPSRRRPARASSRSVGGRHHSRLQVRLPSPKRACALREGAEATPRTRPDGR